MKKLIVPVLSALAILTYSTTLVSTAHAATAERHADRSVKAALEDLQDAITEARAAFNKYRSASSNNRAVSSRLLTALTIISKAELNYNSDEDLADLQDQLDKADAAFMKAATSFSSSTLILKPSLVDVWYEVPKKLGAAIEAVINESTSDGNPATWRRSARR